MGVWPAQWARGSAGFRVIQPLIACAGLLLAPDSSYAQLNPLIDSLGLTPATVQELTTLCPSGSPNSQGCTTALGNTVAEAIQSVPPEALANLPELTTPIISALDLPGDVASEVGLTCTSVPLSTACANLLNGLALQNLVEAIENVPSEALGILPELVTPIISALDLPADVASVVGSTCTSLPLSTACANLLNGLVLQGPAAQQVVTNAVALSNLQTNRQITDFALSDAVGDGLVPASDSAAVLRTISPAVKSFAISGVSHTDHDGFVVKSPRAINARTPEFDSLDAGITLGMRFDASKALNLPVDSLTGGVFGNYTNSDLDFDSNAVLRKFGFRNAGDASLNSGSGGGYTLLTNGRIYGLALASGEFGSASVHDAILDSNSDFDTAGFASSLIGGVVLPAGPTAKFDLRAGLNYLAVRADNHTDSAQIDFRDGKVDEFSGTFSGRLFTTWIRGRTVVRPFVQGGVDYRFHYENQVEVENVEFSFEEGRTTLFGRVGMDFDIGDRAQAYVAFRGDHNEDFDTVAGQVGFTLKLN